MSERLKEFVAEFRDRQAKILAPPLPPSEPEDPNFALFDKAAEFIDEGWDGQGWRPSYRLTLVYCIFATGSQPHLAANWANRQLDRARQRYRDGYYANPFTKDSVPRASA